jgi:hypothetical protein
MAGLFVEKVVISLGAEFAMMRIITALAIVLVILAAMPQPATAKSPTAKITISGGELAKEIEFTDPQILNLSNVWAESFSTLQKGRHKNRRLGCGAMKCRSLSESPTTTYGKDTYCITTRVLLQNPVTFTCRAKERLGTPST